MRNGRCFSLLASLVAVFAFADTSGLASGDSWPANVRVNQDQAGNHQGETLLAVDPRDPLHLVALFWEVISYDPQAPGKREKRLNWAWSRDGGLTWGSRRFENGVYSSDPSIVADRQGNFYIETILVPHFPDQTDVSIGILKSTDGGETFVKTADVGLNRLMDKPYMTIDPANDALYVVWTDFGTTRGPNVVRIYFSGQIALSTAVIRDRTGPSPALCSCRDRMPVTGGAAGRTGPGPAEPVPDSGTEDKKEDGSCANRSFTR